MSAVAVRNLYSDLYGSGALPALDKIFKSELAQHESRRSVLFNMRSTDRDITQMTAYHDLPLFNSVPENTEYSYERSKQGANKTLTVVKYGLGFSISRETVDDGKFEWISMLTKKLARSARESQEIQAMNMFNNGFSGGTETSPDGQPIFASAHTLPSGGTYRNILSAAADLSQSSLSTALSDFEQVFVGDSGIINLMRPKFLVVHPDSKRYAMELTGSDLKPDTANNNLNAIKSDGLQVVSSPHLTDNDAWFLMAAPGEHNLDIVVRNAIRTEAGSPDLGFHTDSIFYKASYREVIGCGEPVGLFGTPGA
jgi:hypothetical protein